jgi:6-phosphogluconolactonase
MKSKAVPANPSDITRYRSRQVLAEALAGDIARMLRDAIRQRGTASLAVSGGSTPKLLFPALAKQALDWSKVTVTLVDERWVPATSDRSNARLVGDLLLTGAARSARFVELHHAGLSVEEALPLIERDLASMRLPLDVVVLGMGADGHTASFFPGGIGLGAAVDANTTAKVAVVTADAAQEARVTLTLPEIALARHLILHFEGEAKLDVFEAALLADNPDDLPIRHVLAARPDIAVHWTA